MDNKLILKLFVTGFTFIAAAGGVWAWGYYVGVAKHEGEVNLFREQNIEYQKQLDYIRAENKALSIQSSKTNADFIKTPVEHKAIRSGIFTLDLSSKTNIENASLSVGQTAELFNSMLLITLSGVEFIGLPFRHVVTASIGSPGKNNIQLEAVDPGYRIEYAGFEIRVNGSGINQASFSALRLEPKP